MSFVLHSKVFLQMCIRDSVNQVLKEDSVVCDFNAYPYRAVTYAKMCIRDRFIVPSTTVGKNMMHRPMAKGRSIGNKMCIRDRTRGTRQPGCHSPLPVIQTSEVCNP